MRGFKRFVFMFAAVLLICAACLAGCDKEQGFTVSFNGSGGTLVRGEEVQKVKAGADIKPPVYEKTGYTLSWNISAFDSISSDITVTAVWTAISYKITYNGNGADGGETADSTHTYDEFNALTENGFTRSGYTFAGWAASSEGEVLYSDKESVKNLTTVKDGWVTLYAKWARQTFRYTFYDDDGVTKLKEETVDYGSPIEAPANPTKHSTAQYNYTFMGWDKEIPSAITEDITFTAVYTSTVRKYIYAFYNGSEVLKYETVEYGSKIVEPEPPTRAPSQQYEYIFAGWDKEVPDIITGNIEFEAVFTTSIRRFTYTFYDEDGVTILKRETVYYEGEIIEPEEPKKAATAQYTYVFSGWDQPVPQRIYEDISFTATYYSITNRYKYAFFDGENELKSELADYGSEIIAPEHPYKEPDEQFIYTFAGWDKDIPDFISGNIVFYAVYSKTLQKYSYIFYDEDGVTVLKEATVDYGSGIVPPDDPVKAPTRESEYSFSGWDKYIPETITHNISFIAQFTSFPRRYTVTFETNGGSALSPVRIEYNNPLIMGQDTYRDGYELSGWYRDAQFENVWNFLSDVVTEDIILYAEWYVKGLSFALYGDEYEVSRCFDYVTGSVAIPKTLSARAVVKISANAFKDAAGVTEIIIPESIGYIGDYAFSGCISLTDITLPKNLVYLGKYAFQNCSSLESIVLPDSITVIGEGLFKGCKELESVTYNDITQISSYAFYGCESLTDITLPDCISDIGTGAFYGCSGLTNIVIPDMVESIEAETFADTALKYVRIGNGVRSIGSNAFRGCGALIGLTLPSGVSYIYDDALSDCDRLAYLIIESTAPPVLEKGSLPGVLSGIKIYVPAVYVEVFKSAPVWSSYIGQIYSKDIIEGDFAIEDGILIQYLSDMPSVTVPTGVTAIASKVFKENLNLKGIILPNTLTVIGTAAFYGCESLESITLPDSLLTIGHYAFLGCAALKNLIIPDSVVAIGESAFEGCVNLDSVTIGAKSMGDNVFANCIGLESVTIGTALERISSSAFYGCIKLNNITIPENVTSIGEYAFYGCGSLTDIIIPANVTDIEEYAFSGCEGLLSITLLAAEPPEYSIYAFTGTPVVVKFYVAADRVEAYKSSDKWSSYSSQIFAIED